MVGTRCFRYFGLLLTTWLLRLLDDGVVLFERREDLGLARQGFVLEMTTVIFFREYNVYKTLLDFDVPHVIRLFNQVHFHVGVNCVDVDVLRLHGLAQVFAEEFVERFLRIHGRGKVDAPLNLLN